ncbi:MAG: hypothetical protein ACRD1R_06335 [Acidobacteriota bacterium]
MAGLRYIAIFKNSLECPVDLLSLARVLSPRFEVIGDQENPDGILLESSSRQEKELVEGLSQYAGKLNLAAASTCTAALLAARARPGTAVPPAKEGEFLAPLPVRLLLDLAGILSLTDGKGQPPAVKELIITLKRWGIRTLGELAALPREELITRFGLQGAYLQKIAQGQDLRPFQAWLEEPVFEELQDLDWTLGSLEPLSFILDKFIKRLCGRVQGRGLAVHALRIVLGLEDGSAYERSLRLAIPLNDPTVLLSLLRLDLQANPPQSGIQRVLLQAEPARPRRFQHSLFRPIAPSPEKLSRTLALLENLVGKNEVGSPALLDTHRPDAFELRPFQGLRPEARGPRLEALGLKKTRGEQQTAQLSLKRVRPPRPIDIRSEVPGDPGPSRQIVSCAGPWRSSGDWWSGEPWSRDEWDVELADGSIYRIYWDRKLEGWFLEGIYD